MGGSGQGSGGVRITRNRRERAGGNMRYLASVGRFGRLMATTSQIWSVPRTCSVRVLWRNNKDAFEWQPSLTCSPAKAGVQSGSPPSRGNKVRRKRECREPGMTEVDQAAIRPNDPPPPGGGVAEGDGGGGHGTAVSLASPSVRLRPATSPLRGRIVESRPPDERQEDGRWVSIRPEPSVPTARLSAARRRPACAGASAARRSPPGTRCAPSHDRRRGSR